MSPTVVVDQVIHGAGHADTHGLVGVGVPGPRVFDDMEVHWCGCATTAGCGW